MIINFGEIMGSDFSMEQLVKKHSEEKTDGFLRFLNKICSKEEGGGGWEEKDVDVQNKYII